MAIQLVFQPNNLIYSFIYILSLLLFDKKKEKSCNQSISFDVIARLVLIGFQLSHKRKSSEMK